MIKKRPRGARASEDALCLSQVSVANRMKLEALALATYCIISGSHFRITSGCHVVFRGSEV